MTAPARLTQFDFHHRLAETPGVSLVLFTRPGCGACRHWRALLERYSADPRVAQHFEVDVEQDIALAREFAVFHLPALFLYRDGQFHAELRCEAQAERLTAAIAQALAAPAQDMP